MVEAEQNDQVTVKHVLKATASLFGSPLRQRIAALSIQPKLVLYIMILLFNQKVKQISQMELYFKYKQIAGGNYGFDLISQSDFSAIIGQLQDGGVISSQTKKGEQLWSLNCSVEEVLLGIKSTSKLIDKLMESDLKLK
jgi:Cdc6-like AAA superfamily ATPase